uniref:Uncharacterized protein n=1 Tax=Vespula pensylvanica TaxID=30213 RepID=A0A834PA81_VESPE|nr:hypothetical protein H0235_002414 [Vespula pensylvanica]
MRLDDSSEWIYYERSRISHKTDGPSRIRAATTYNYNDNRSNVEASSKNGPLQCRNQAFKSHAALPLSLLAFSVIRSLKSGYPLNESHLQKCVLMHDVKWGWW